MALFITFEGGEGCGKSVQSRRLYRRFIREGLPALLTHEPGVTDLGKRVTRLLKWSDDLIISPMAELLLFNTSRAQLVEELIRPGLENNVNVICDRYADSSTAYQGYGRKLDIDTVTVVNHAATHGLKPDLTVLLDMPVEKGLARKGENKDRLEKESIGFHNRVRKGYLTMSKTEPERWLVVDATQGKDKIEDIIWQKVSKLIPR